jgi:Cu(I)/Ag(I) efflux system membrane protein CusA/SilA
MMIGSTIIAVTLVPVLCTFMIRGRLHREEDNPVMRILRGIYAPACGSHCSAELTLGSAVVLFVFALYLASSIGSEFMPPLDEQTAMWMPVTDPSISLTQAQELMRIQDGIIAQDPAVETVVGKIGRAETSTDPAPINMSETMLPSNRKISGRRV